jgi:hypothetical protein
LDKDTRVFPKYAIPARGEASRRKPKDALFSKQVRFLREAPEVPEGSNLFLKEAEPLAAF